MDHWLIDHPSPASLGGRLGVSASPAGGAASLLDEDVSVRPAHAAGSLRQKHPVRHIRHWTDENPLLAGSLGARLITGESRACKSALL